MLGRSRFLKNMAQRKPFAGVALEIGVVMPDPSEIPDQTPPGEESPIPEEMPNQDPAAEPPPLKT